MNSSESLYGITAQQKIIRLRETVDCLQGFRADSSTTSDQPDSNTQRVTQFLPDLREVLEDLAQQEGDMTAASQAQVQRPLTDALHALDLALQALLSLLQRVRQASIVTALATFRFKSDFNTAKVAWSDALGGLMEHTSAGGPTLGSIEDLRSKLRSLNFDCAARECRAARRMTQQAIDLEDGLEEGDAQRGIQELGELHEAAQANHVEIEACFFKWLKKTLENLLPQLEAQQLQQHPPANVMAGQSTTPGVLPPRDSLAMLDQHMPSWYIQPDCIIPCRQPNGEDVELGTGASGTVKKCLLFGRNGREAVAVKFLQPFDRYRSMPRATQRELRVLSEHIHENLVRFVGATVVRGQLAIVTELMQTDLWHLLDGDWSWGPRALQIGIDVARGLEYLHVNGVLHLDLKSLNVLMHPNGQAKLADLGMARICQASRVQLSTVVGTWAWTAPEILMRQTEATIKADIFSLGVVLWELQSAEHPEQFTPLTCSQDPRLEWLNDLITWCLKPEPEERPSASTVATILENMRLTTAQLFDDAPAPPQTPLQPEGGYRSALSGLEINTPPESPIVSPFALECIQEDALHWQGPSTPDQQPALRTSADHPTDGEAAIDQSPPLQAPQ
ncbi:hypothetical protein WJX73_008050 [Symbiochloris irregularis]|uniref:Protein kinase domain-containing protein n=1 Tax=Symbiochloris irregularis TaxID=706552 RepID=A0AAW1NNT9_9CHLO